MVAPFGNLVLKIPGTKALKFSAISFSILLELNNKDWLMPAELHETLQATQHSTQNPVLPVPLLQLVAQLEHSVLNCITIYIYYYAIA